MNGLVRTTPRGMIVRHFDLAMAEARMDECLEIVRQFHPMSWTRENVLIELPGKWDVSLAAIKEDGALCGFSVNSLREESLYIHLLVVHELFRGRGVGSALLARASELATERAGVRCLRLKTTVDWVDTMRFYLRHGFVVRDKLPETQQYVLELPVRGGVT